MAGHHDAIGASSAAQSLLRSAPMAQHPRRVPRWRGWRSQSRSAMPDRGRPFHSAHPVRAGVSLRARAGQNRGGAGAFVKRSCKLSSTCSPASCNSEAFETASSLFGGSTTENRFPMPTLGQQQQAAVRAQPSPPVLARPARASTALRLRRSSFARLTRLACCVCSSTYSQAGSEFNSRMFSKQG